MIVIGIKISLRTFRDPTGFIGAIGLRQTVGLEAFRYAYSPIVFI